MSALVADRLKLAHAIGSANERTGHVYIDGNDACLEAADAVIATGVFKDEREVKAAAWDEGMAAGESMADSYGHTANWLDRKRPANPYRAAQVRR